MTNVNRALISTNMEQYVPCWRKLDVTHRNRITEDISAKWGEFSPNQTVWADFASFVANYTTVVEIALKRLETDEEYQIWTMWGEILEHQKYGIY